MWLTGCHPGTAASLPGGGLGCCSPSPGIKGHGHPGTWKMHFPWIVTVQGGWGRMKRKHSDKTVVPKLIFILNLYLCLSYNHLSFQHFFICVWLIHSLLFSFLLPILQCTAQVQEKAQIQESLCWKWGLRQTGYAAGPGSCVSSLCWPRVWPLLSGESWLLPPSLAS